MSKGHLVVGVRHALVCEVEDLDPSQVVQISLDRLYTY
jgi:hypothetical protein